MPKKKENKKICIFTGFALPHLGGVERYTDKLVNELKKLNCDITIVTCNNANTKSYEKLENYQIIRLPIFNIVKERYPIPKKNKEYKELMAEIKSNKFDAIICQTRFYLTSQIGAKLAKEQKIPLLVIEHGSSHFTVNNKILDFFGAKYEHYLTNRLKKYNPKFYGVSNRCNEWLKHFKIEASGVLYNSVDANVYNLFKDKKYIDLKDKLIISYIGRIIKEKGVEMLLNVFQQLSNKYKDIELIIAGDGPELEIYKQKYKQKNIHFTGKLNYDEVMSLCNQTDIFVHPSMYPEGLPTSILEAGIMKSAVIATDRGGTIEVINNKEYGLIMEENEASLEEKLNYLLTNRKEIKNLKENLNKRIIENFTWNITAKKVLKEIELNEKN